MIRLPFSKRSTTPTLSAQLADIWSEVVYQDLRWSWMDRLEELLHL